MNERLSSLEIGPGLPIDKHVSTGISKARSHSSSGTKIQDNCTVRQHKLCIALPEPRRNNYAGMFSPSCTSSFQSYLQDLQS